MRSFFIGKRNKKIEKKALVLGLEIVFIKEISNVKELDIKKDLKDYDGILIKNQNIDVMRRIIDKSQNSFKNIMILGMNDEINRACLEHKKTSSLLSPEFNRAKDYINYRNSGLNQVLCKIAKENNKEIIENLSDLQGEKKNQSLILGKMLQNARLCKRYGVKFLIAIITKNEKEFLSSDKLENFSKTLFSR